MSTNKEKISSSTIHTRFVQNFLTDRKYSLQTKSNPVSNRGETSSMADDAITSQQHEDPLQNVLEQSARALGSHPRPAPNRQWTTVESLW